MSSDDLIRVLSRENFYFGNKTVDPESIHIHEVSLIVGLYNLFLTDNKSVLLNITRIKKIQSYN